MADQASDERIRIGHRPIAASTSPVDFESAYPEWAKDVKVRPCSSSTTKVEDEGRVPGAALGCSVRYVLAYDYSGSTGSFSWHFVGGDMLRRLDGSTGSSRRTTTPLECTTTSPSGSRYPFQAHSAPHAAGLIMGSALKGAQSTGRLKVIGSRCAPVLSRTSLRVASPAPTLACSCRILLFTELGWSRQDDVAAAGGFDRRSRLRTLDLSTDPAHSLANAFGCRAR